MTHPLGIAPGEIIVDGDEVGAAPSERVQIQGQCRNERLAFARRHLGNFALVKNDAADELHVVRHHVPFQRVPGHDDLGAQQAARSLAHRRERLGQ